jgi:ankyrin repeat protein
MNGKPIALLLSICVLAGCKDRGESAKQELKDSGYELTPEAFFRAAESDDVAALEKLVKGGIALETKNAAGDTALHAAAVAGMRKSADFLLDRKLPVDVTGANGRTPLMSAVLLGSPEMVRYLLSQKADPLKKDAEGIKPLMLAVRAGRAEMVAELAPYDREKLDDALLVAALEGKAGVIDELTNYGASVYARMDDGRTPLMLAAENGHVEAVEMLIEIGANRFSMDDQGRIAADMAREAGHEQLAMRLAEEPGKDEFGIEEPADLGAEMLAKVTAAEEGSEASAEAGIPGTTVPAQDGGVPAVGPSPLDGMVLESVSEGAMPAKQPLVMRAYRQKELPLRVESVTGEVATLRMSGGGVKQVSQGEVIPGTPLKVVRVERRMQDVKDQAGRTEVSVVEVEDESSGRRRELVSGLESTAHDPVALVEDAGGKRYMARAGQKFRGADGSEYVVIDVRPNQMVIENRTAGEVITVPLRGPRG